MMDKLHLQEATRIPPEVMRRISEEARRLSEKLGKPINAGAVRVSLHRAREVFGDLLLAEVAESLVDASLDDVEQELIELVLLEYCRPALERRRKVS